jgi:hypothetical protein
MEGKFSGFSSISHAVLYPLICINFLFKKSRESNGNSWRRGLKGGMYT